MGDGHMTLPVTLIYYGAIHKSQLKKKSLEKKQWDLLEAALAAVILTSGVWMIIAGLMEL
jgi:hypothetical protein